MRAWSRFSQNGIEWKEGGMVNLLGVDNVHDHAALEHLSQPGLHREAWVGISAIAIDMIVCTIGGSTICKVRGVRHTYDALRM